MSFKDSFYQKKASSDYAKERLKLLLMSDRVNCSPDIIEQIKNDIVNVVSRYAKVDMHNLDIRIIQSETHEDDGAVSALHANIPFVDMKTKSIK